MRLHHEVRLADPPRSLLVENNVTNNFDDILSKNTADQVSPETLNHRLQKGWQHLEESPETLLNNNNNEPLDLNDNPNFNDITLASPPNVSATFADGDYRAMSSDDSGSSSDDESSATYSDTSPLLDVSSLCNSDVSLDSDMSEDSSSTSSEDFVDEIVDEECNNNNNNNEEEFANEDDGVVSAEMPSMQSSWMSFSSSASTPSVACASQNHVVLPDVLPVGKVSKDDDEALTSGNTAIDLYETCRSRNRDLSIEKRRSAQDISENRLPGDRYGDEVALQPDIQPVNSITSRPYRESKPVSIKHGNTYPRENRNKRYSKNKDITAWIVNDSFDEHYDEGVNKNCSLGEGVRLNNFTIVNGHKTLSLTELVNSYSDEDNELTSKLNADNLRPLVSKANGPVLTNSYQNFERNYSKLPASVHLYCQHNWRFPNESIPSVVTQQKSVTDDQILEKSNISTSPKKEPKLNSMYEPPKPPMSNENSHQNPTSPDGNSNKLTQTKSLPLSNDSKDKSIMSYYTARTKPSEIKKPSTKPFPLLHARGASASHANWSTSTKGYRESEWIRKRRNDREEIRRKLAMDSDTEDYISEKLNQHRQNGDSFNRLKGAGNLQICFMNEVAKDNPEDTREKSITSPSTNISKPSFTPTSISLRPDKVPTKSPFPISVTKRQRPKFFFNRPRSWHASKTDDSMKPFPEEDLLTRHTRLQAEAREALSQAKEMARMQMEIERQKKKKSPIADIVGFQFPDGKNLLTPHALVAMNLAQLQVIVNDLHSQIETLNEDLVKFLLDRDDLHMEQDSMLVDIEDLTRYLGLKGSNSVSSSSSQISINSPADETNKPEPVRRSQSVHLKSKNLM